MAAMLQVSYEIVFKVGYSAVMVGNVDEMDNVEMNSTSGNYHHEGKVNSNPPYQDTTIFPKRTIFLRFHPTFPIPEHEINFVYISIKI